MKKSTIHPIGRMALASLLSLSTAAAVVTVPQLTVVAHAADATPNNIPPLFEDKVGGRDVSATVNFTATPVIKDGLLTPKTTVTYTYTNSSTYGIVSDLQMAIENTAHNGGGLAAYTLVDFTEQTKTFQSQHDEFDEPRTRGVSLSAGNTSLPRNAYFALIPGGTATLTVNDAELNATSKIYLYVENTDNAALPLWIRSDGQYPPNAASYYPGDEWISAYLKQGIDETGSAPDRAGYKERFKRVSGSQKAADLIFGSGNTDDGNYNFRFALVPESKLFTGNSLKDTMKRLTQSSPWSTALANHKAEAISRIQAAAATNGDVKRAEDLLIEKINNSADLTEISKYANAATLISQGKEDKADKDAAAFIAIEPFKKIAEENLKEAKAADNYQDALGFVTAANQAAAQAFDIANKDTAHSDTKKAAAAEVKLIALEALSNAASKSNATSADISGAAEQAIDAANAIKELVNSITDSNPDDQAHGNLILVKAYKEAAKIAELAGETEKVNTANTEASTAATNAKNAADKAKEVAEADRTKAQDALAEYEAINPTSDSEKKKKQAAKETAIAARVTEAEAYQAAAEAYRDATEAALLVGDTATAAATAQLAREVSQEIKATRTAASTLTKESSFAYKAIEDAAKAATDAATEANNSIVEAKQAAADAAKKTEDIKAKKAEAVKQQGLAETAKDEAEKQKNIAVSDGSTLQESKDAATEAGQEAKNAADAAKAAQAAADEAKKLAENGTEADKAAAQAAQEAADKAKADAAEAKKFEAESWKAVAEKSDTASDAADAAGYAAQAAKDAQGLAGSESIKDQDSADAARAHLAAAQAFQSAAEAAQKAAEKYRDEAKADNATAEAKNQAATHAYTQAENAQTAANAAVKEYEAVDGNSAADEKQKQDAQAAAIAAKLAEARAFQAAAEAAAAAGDLTKAQAAAKEAATAAEAVKTLAGNESDAAKEAEKAVEDAQAAVNTAQKAQEAAQKENSEAIEARKAEAVTQQKIAEDAKKSAQEQKEIAASDNSTVEQAEAAATKAREEANKAQAAANAAQKAADEAKKLAENGTEADKAAANAAQAAADKAKDAAKVAATDANTAEHFANTKEATINKQRTNATKYVDGLAHLSEEERADLKKRISEATTSAEVDKIFREALAKNVNNDPSLTNDQRNALINKINNYTDKGVDNIINQYEQDKGEVTNPSNVNPSEGGNVGSSTSNWWKIILALLGVGGVGALGWGYVHDADFRAVVDGAIANVQRGIDDARANVERALGLRR